MVNSTSRAKAPEERFWNYVDATGDCWEWTGSRNPNGYGRFCPTSHTSTTAHRFAWQALIGPIPDEMEVDHLCRNRGCVNPDHLEVVTHHENCHRGYLVWMVHRARTHCKHGHAFTPENTGEQYHGGRFCRICQNGYSRKSRASARLRRAK